MENFRWIAGGVILACGLIWLVVEVFPKILSGKKLPNWNFGWVNRNILIGLIAFATALWVLNYGLVLPSLFSHLLASNLFISILLGFIAYKRAWWALILVGGYLFFWPLISSEINKHKGTTAATATLTRQTFLFADAKGQEVYVNVPKGRKPHFYPKGGQINICPPDGNCYVDTPGVDSYPVVKRITGVWKITPSSQTAIGVEVWLE